jgi:hypothetical protein
MTRPGHGEDIQQQGLANPCFSVESDRPVMQVMNPMRRWFWTDQLIDSCRLEGLFRGDGFYVLARFDGSLPILQGCFEERDECWLDFDAVLLFQMCRQLRSRNISDFPNGKSKKLQRFHWHPPGDLLEPGMYRQLGQSVFNGGRFLGSMMGDVKDSSPEHS